MLDVRYFVVVQSCVISSVCVQHKNLHFFPLMQPNLPLIQHSCVCDLKIKARYAIDQYFEKIITYKLILL